MIRRLLGATAAVALLLSAGATVAQDISAERLSDHIRTLADDSFQGRFPGKVGEELTLKYLQAQYEAMGYAPGGPDGSWLQPVDLVRYTPSRAPTVSWKGHDGVSHTLTSATDITLRPLTGEGAIQIADAPVVFAGFGIVAPERGWDDYGDMDLTGKIVVILRGQPTVFGEDPNFYGAAEHKQAEAFKRGALGVLTLVEGEGAEARWRRSAFGASRARMTIAGAQTVSFNGSLNGPAAQAMAASHGGQLAAFVEKAKLGGAFKAMDTGVKLSLDIAENREVIRSHNLLAKLPGTTRADEYVVYSAHWDHIGLSDKPNDAGDAINNGAWDNASGTAGVLEVARALKAGPAPARSIIFLHVTAEEQGLLGSQWYAENPVYPLAKTAADINIDMLPFTPATTTVALFGIGKSSLEDDLAALAARQGGRTIVGDGEPEQGFYYRSDHFNFAMGGVPAIMPWTSVDFAQGGAAVGKPYYLKQMEDFYHGPEDEWRADIDYTAAVQNLQLLVQLGQQVANSDQWPQWKPDAEFRALREQTADQRK